MKPSAVSEIVGQTAKMRSVAATAGIKDSISRMNASRKAFDSILGRGTILDTITRFDKQMKMLTSSPTAEITSAHSDLVSGYSKQISDGFAPLTGGVAHQMRKPFSFEEIVPSVSMKVNFEPPGALSAIHAIRDSVGPLMDSATGSIAAQITGLSSKRMVDAALGDMRGNLQQLVGKSFGADFGRAHKHLLHQIKPLVDVEALVGMRRNAAFTGAGQLATDARRMAIAPRLLDQLVPPSIRDHVTSWKWPDSMTQAFDLARESWARRMALEEELDGTMAARLLFMLDNIAAGLALTLMERLAAEGIDPLLDLLEAALITPEALAVFWQIADRSPHLRDSVRGDLRRGVEHLEDSDFDAAVPDLMLGLEGACRDGARAKGSQKLHSNAQSAIVKIGLDQEHELFLRQAVYSGGGNNARHGEEADRRAVSLLALVGLLCWFEEFSGQPAIKWLGRRLDSELRRSALAP